MKNSWLFSNETTLMKLKRILIEMEYIPIFQDYPVRTMQGILNGFETEVLRLQGEVDNLKNENNKLKEENKNMSKNKEASEAPLPPPPPPKRIISEDIKIGEKGNKNKKDADIGT